MKNLRLPLKKQWFEMTKAGIKKEDYREITPYWCSRLLIWKNGKKNTKIEWGNKLRCSGEKMLIEYLSNKSLSFEHFDINIMTLGYPKSTDTNRILKLEHKGIEIRTGNPEWGAEPGKLYFVIKHGEIII